MKILDLVQGSDEWKAKRLECITASEAPAMMGASKYMTRNQLLDMKKGAAQKPVDKFTQELFDKGHAAEDSARRYLEINWLADFPPKVGMLDIGAGIELLASFDGCSESMGMIWEHKLWNEVLAENVRNQILEPMYYWQLEFQMLVADKLAVTFTCSDGTQEKSVTMIYTSKIERRDQLVAAIKQFAIDLQAHEVKAKTEVVKAVDPESLPVIDFKVEGSVIVSNIGDCLPIIQERAASEMSRVLETEQDFADKHKLNVATKAARAKLKEVVAQAKDEFATFADFERVAAQIDMELQKMQSHGEKQVKEQKAALKVSIITKAAQKLFEFTNDCNAKIAPITVSQIKPDCKPDFEGVMKGKRTIESWQNAVDSEVSRIEGEINETVNIVIPNLAYINESASEYKFLFSDMHAIICMGAEAFQSVVKTRIQEHKERQAKELEEQREKIRLEEEAKAKREAEAEREKIRKEEREKAQAEEQDRREEVETPSLEASADHIQTCNMNDDYVEAAPEDMPSVSGQKAVITDQVIVEFLKSQLNDVTDFGYLLVSDDPQHNAEALANLKHKYQVFVGNK